MLPLGDAFATPNDATDAEAASVADAMRASPELVLPMLLVEASVLLASMPPFEPPQPASARVSVSNVAAARRPGIPKCLVLIMLLA
jgi:hypothetical protein